MSSTEVSGLNPFADFLRALPALLLRALWLLMGLVFFISLLAAALLLALVWALRALWATVTGRPVTPWVLRVDPRTGFGAAFRASGRWPSGGRRPAPDGDGAAPDVNGAAPPAQSGPAPRRGGVLPGADDEVTDVEPRDKR